MAALIYLVTVIALTRPPPAVSKAVRPLEGPVTHGPAPTQTAGVREVSVAVKEGQNVTLLCRASGIDEDATIIWTRGNQTIFLYRDGLPDPDGQHPSYVGRVKLVDQSPTENGDLSVILMNVSSSDIGTFKCSIKDPEDKVIKDLGTVHLSVLVSDTQVTVKPGGEAPLDCQADRDGSIEQIAWSKTDLESDKYVFFFRGNDSLKDYQHPSFRGRVELLDPQRKKGNASIVLKNVTVSDSGTYECVVSTSSGGRRRKRAAPFRHIVHLKVADSGPDWVLIIGLTAGLVVICVSVVIGLLVKKRLMKKKSEQPAAEEQQLSSSEPVEVQCLPEV